MRGASIFELFVEQSIKFFLSLNAGRDNKFNCIRSFLNQYTQAPHRLLLLPRPSLSPSPRRGTDSLQPISRYASIALDCSRRTQCGPALQRVSASRSSANWSFLNVVRPFGGSDHIRSDSELTSSDSVSLRELTYSDTIWR